MTREFDFERDIQAYQANDAGTGTRHDSWRHCYEFFGDKPGKDLEKATLHIAFYLASWGMYRGSTFLLKHDFTIHEPVVQELIKPENMRLRGLSIESFADHVDDLVRLSDSIIACYGVRSSDKVSVTLVTKVLLGTLGCCPAYDRYVQSGMGDVCLPRPQKLNERSLTKLHGWVVRYRSRFERASEILQAEVSAEYPIMKIVDMWFWWHGRRVEERRRRMRERR